MSTSMSISDAEAPWDAQRTQEIIDRMDTSTDLWSSYQEKCFERSGYATPFDIAQPTW